MSEFLNFATSYTLLGITLGQYVSAFFAVLIAVTLRKVFSHVIVGMFRKFSHRTSTDLDDNILTAVEAPLGFAFILAGLYAAVVILQLPNEPVNVERAVFLLLKALVIVDVTWLLLRVVDAFSTFLSHLASNTSSKLDDQLIPIVRKTIKVFVGLLCFIAVVQNFGYSAGSLLAGLGIGGLAFALAAQDTLSNFFGSLTILIDRPFEVGDWIETQDNEGVVEEVGFRSTRIRTFGKTQLSIPNSVLANSAVNNWSRMPIRRVKMVVGVTYESSASQMEQAVQGIRDLLAAHPKVHQDFFLVNFTDFGASSLDIFTYYFTTTTVWAEYLAVRQEINLSIMKLLEELGMEVAFPTRTVYVKGEDPPALAPTKNPG